MSPVFTPRVDILPEAQRRLWPELSDTPSEFTLYGGTAIALRLGHRQSIDFDFFAQTSFEPDTLLKDIPYLKRATIRQSSPNLAAASVIFGPQFNPLDALKAIAYHEDPALADLSDQVKRDVVKAVQSVDPENLPSLNPIRKWQAGA
jgi:Nucleotidyl transferase AbiEii toxin, Type IV TA system